MGYGAAEREKHASLIQAQLLKTRAEENKLRKKTSYEAPVITGHSDAKSTDKAVRQIAEDFKKVKYFKVGCQKPTSGALD
jgi:hypothetical protein